MHRLDLTSALGVYGMYDSEFFFDAVRKVAMRLKRMALLQT